MMGNFTTVRGVQACCRDRERETPMQARDWTRAALWTGAILFLPIGPAARIALGAHRPSEVTLSCPMGFLWGLS
jgi:hypothetical protein